MPHRQQHRRNPPDSSTHPAGAAKAPTPFESLIMERHNLIQGSPEWLAFRKDHFTASDAPAMLGISPHKTREALLREKTTGIRPEVDAAAQRRFDEGHRIEALARPLAEKELAEELYPITGSNGKLAASFDGLTMLEDVVWEHKTLNQSLREVMQPKATGQDLPEHYRAQLEHQLMVSGASRALFTASQWAGNELQDIRHAWYESDRALRDRIIDGWAQFEKDLANWRPAPQAVPVTAAPVESLPAVVVSIAGSLAVTDNLAAVGQALRAFVARIPAQPQTDQEFADCDAACKTLKKAEAALTAAEDNALAQMSDVEQMRRTVTDLKNLARTTRLATEKLVKAEKDARRAERVMKARAAWQACHDQLAQELQGTRLDVPAPDFGEAIKGLSSLESIDNKLQAAMLAGQAELQARAHHIRHSLQMLTDVPEAYRMLFADRQELALKDHEALRLIIDERIRQHQQAEAQRLEAERERIRAEEQAKAEAAAQAAAQQQAAPQPQTPPAEPAAPIAESPALKLGDINERIAPLSITADGLRQLGFEPAATQRRACLYHEAQWPAIRAALLGCINRN